MQIIGEFLILALDIYTFIILAMIISSWLIAFGVLDARHPYTEKALRFLKEATDPVMEPIRKAIPSIGGIDISPIIVIFGITFLQRLIASVFIYQGM